VRTTFTAKLRLYEKDPETGLRGTELTTTDRNNTVVMLGTPLFLEADFEESHIFSGYETGFRECIVASDENMISDRTTLIMPLKGKEHQYNCKASSFKDDPRFEVHQASSTLTDRRVEILTKSLYEFPAFRVS
jgi:hypothetical protein